MGRWLSPQPSHVTSPAAVMLLPNKLTVASWLRGISTRSSNVSISRRTLNKPCAARPKRRSGKKPLWHSPAATDMLTSCVNVLKGWVCLSACLSVRGLKKREGPTPLPSNLTVRHTYRPCLVTWQVLARPGLGGVEEDGEEDGGKKRVRREGGRRFLNIEY